MGEGGKLKHQELTYKIIGCAQNIHTTLGPGFPESVYHRAMCRELLTSRIPFESEKPYEVWYNGAICGEFRADLVVAGLVVVELKALSDLTGEHPAQTLSYLRASKLDLALLVNFGRQSLQTKRVVL